MPKLSGEELFVLEVFMFLHSWNRCKQKMTDKVFDQLSSKIFDRLFEEDDLKDCMEMITFWDLFLQWVFLGVMHCIGKKIVGNIIESIPGIRTILREPLTCDQLRVGVAIIVMMIPSLICCSYWMFFLSRNSLLH